MLQHYYLFIEVQAIYSSFSSCSDLVQVICRALIVFFFFFCSYTFPCVSIVVLVAPFLELILSCYILKEWLLAHVYGTNVTE